MKNLVAYTDGGSRGNPGHSAIGVAFSDGTRYKHYIGIQTNNVAEYTALLAAIYYAVEEKYEVLHVFADSELMVKQIKGLYEVKNEKLRQIYDKIIMQLVNLKEFAITHIPREKNIEADKLVNEALDEHLQSSVPKRARKNRVLRGKLPDVPSAKPTRNRKR